MMNLAKLNPRNWFKHEEAQDNSAQSIPVKGRQNSELATSRDSGANSLLRLHREMDQLFDDVFNVFGMPSIARSLPMANTLSNNSFRPLIDVSGDEKAYKIDLDVPGLQESDLSIEVKGDTLFIKGQKEESSESKDKHYYRIERSIGSFQRTLALPEDANSDDISASLKDGVLTLSIPRQETSHEEVKKISIS